ncbi:MAG TPA: alpha/beta hydrolase [Acidimicrobiia bacterium]|nr:alpha/beta hydrolase [Acidimicrobiia bacterium]
MQPGTERWIDADGVRVHAVEWGDPDREHRILLVHGLGANTLSWEPIGGPLAAALDATVTAIDLPGFGLTRLPPGRRAAVGASGRLVAAVLADVVGPAVVFGNSMGGAISVGLAARRPDLVRALVLVDPAVPQRGARLPPWQLVARMAPLMVPQLGGRFIGVRARRLGPAGMVDSTLEWSVAYPERVDPTLRERLIALATQRSAFPEVPAAYADAARSLFFYFQGGMNGDLARVPCPTLIVHGELDRLVPVGSARAVAARHPEFALEVIEDCGHAPQLELPDRFLELVTPWLAGLPATVSE